MSLMWVVFPAAVFLSLAYLLYGRWLSRQMQLRSEAVTPATELRDGIDFEPVPPSVLLPQHFSAIAAAGPIVGPILAGLTFGWLPALIWILLGSIFIGGVHDYFSLVASLRNRGRSIADVIREHMTRRSYLLFLTFIWIALVYIIVAFTDVTAEAFIGPAKAENGGVGGGAIATSSLLYLLLTLVMGIGVRRWRWPVGRTTAIFLGLVVAAIIVGPYAPLDLAVWGGWTPGTARKIWDVLLLVYCLIAGAVPVWLLLQPRGQLGGYFLYAALLAGAIGLVLGGGTAEYPAFRGWSVLRSDGSTATLFPLLFITIACGACSGFHSLIASGTTSKQVRCETDALPIGYGAMLLEGMVAIVSLCCVMMFAVGAEELNGNPNQIYAQGIARFLSAVNLPVQIGIAFALMAFTTFVYDTLDVCTRLGRYIVQELTGWKGVGGRWIGTSLTAGVPLYFLLSHPANSPVPVWRIFWELFGASNQLLAALTLLGITVWLGRTQRKWWVWAVTGIPTVFMYVFSTWALVSLTAPRFWRGGEWVWPSDPVPWVGVVLLGLAICLLWDAASVLLRWGPKSQQASLPPETPLTR